MTINHGRRRLLVSTTALAGVSALGAWPLLGHGADDAGDNRPFSFDGLIAHARQLAGQPYQKPAVRHEKLLNDLGYDAFMGIHTRKKKALWAGSDQPFAVEFFHLDQNARQPVAIHVVENGQARPFAYDPELFRYDDPDVARKLPDDLGFAGFRLVDQRGDGMEWLAFKGASYFRSPGGLDQYGLSARGIAVDTGYGEDEQFPRFSAYWLIQPQTNDDSITICALLEGKDITGAYRMRCRRPGDVIMDIESHLFQRTAVRRLGIAPLTSMFWFSETNARRGIDWRPEIHDSDGLAIANGRGERIWRALDNPPRTQYSAFMDENPRGFGLLQRDRDFDHYQDADVGFERRPSLWVEPRGDWGRGHVGLLELPTDEEIYDNINAFWVPDASDAPDRSWRFDYRLSWCAEEPHPPQLARVVATRTGRAGAPGNYDKQSVLARKFVIDFEGGPLRGLDDDSKLELRIDASHGEIVNPYTVKIKDTARWRAFFDWSGELPPADEPVGLRCAMVRGDETLTETWAFSYFPQALPRRLSSEDDSNA
ncbi:glucan biosynthesis protein [Salinisphaera aquimarina]|uniref:Glucans biosynthesis protein D n=1 Tax=Salinisphaera aquimarina TaxID=2094031 RepID=A0ABV7EIZ3_9GAMM